MKKFVLFLILFSAIPTFAAETMHEQSKDDMKRKLDNYVRDNQEASASIAPLIERLRNILGNKPDKILPKDGKD